MTSSATDSPTAVEGIAIVGMSGRFPGARDAAEFWENLCGGKESITRFDDAALLAEGTSAELLQDPAFVRARAVLDQVDQFDAGFFEMRPRDADLTDPQHRVFLECAWEALEDGGCDPARTSGSIGVFAGTSLNTYWLSQVLRNREGIRTFAQRFQVDDYNVLVGADKDYLATRVAYKFNLRGPALTVQSACSTSLVAVAQAVASLQSFQCDQALAGGCSITFPQARGYLYQEGAIASADGHCRAFDAAARGTVFGAGCGVVLLKRVEDALRDGNRIYAVIRSVALNNDGAGKASYSAPSLDGQAEVISLAHALAGVSADSISYVEAHGTGTPLGDPIEVAALTQAFRATTDRRGYCWLGSVKTNIGHLEAAAGVTGLIKTALALHHRRLPPTLHFTEPNPQIDFAASPFQVIAEGRTWDEVSLPRRAGVSSFGVGGTNAHAVLEESPLVDAVNPVAPESLLLVSAKTPSALSAASMRLAEWVGKECPRGEAEAAWLADAAFTLQVGRARFEHRRFCVAANGEEAVAALRAAVPADPSKAGHHDTPELVFLFPGQGAQHANMARDLYDSEAVFRDEVDQCSETLRGPLGLDLREVLYPAADDLKVAESNARLRETGLAQPALFVVEYALARLWMSWGLKPTVLVGHSIGEYVAAVVAGVMSLDDALVLVARRGALMQAAPPGGMWSVRASEDQLRRWIAEPLSIAAVNSPRNCVVAGPAEAFESLRAQLEAEKIAFKPLVTSHAFHSAMMDGVLEPLAAAFRGKTLAAASIPVISSRTGRWIDPQEWRSPDYWVRQVRDPVRFGDAVAELVKQPNRLLLEVGPGQALTQLSRQVATPESGLVAIPSLPPAGEGMGARRSVLNALGRLWSLGLDPDWEALHQGVSRRRISLPTYPFERARHWIAGASDDAVRASTGAEAGMSGAVMATAGREREADSVAEISPAALEAMLLQQLQVMTDQLHVMSGAAGGPVGASVEATRKPFT
ncbi:MAG: type I polyketide synthase [Verrucomicrobiales bacterium]|nr:type I polyketide synthase [Verrucomicrobiales bacterium]